MALLHVIRAATPGIKNGELIIEFLGADQKRYDVALTTRAASEALLALLKGAPHMPELARTTEGTLLQANVAVAVGPEMSAVLLVRIGNLELPLRLTQEQLAVLHADMSQLLEKPAQGH